MKRNFVAHSIVRLTQEYSVTRPLSIGNAQVSNAPVSESQAAFPSSSRPYEGATFHQQKLLLDGAKSSARKNPIEFCRQFDAGRSGLTEKSRIELAKLIVKESPRHLAENIRKFNISNEESRIELARIVAQSCPTHFCSYIHEFSIFDESARIELAHKVAKAEPASLISYIHDFAIFDESARIALAHKAAEKDLCALAGNIRNFAISNENAKIELAQIVAEKSACVLARNIPKFAIADESARIELAHRIAEKDLYTFVQHVQDFAIADESARIELAYRVAEINPHYLTSHIQNFAIADESARIGLAQFLIGKHLSITLIENGGYLGKFQISNPSAKANLYAWAYLGLIAKGAVSATDEKWTNNFFFPFRLQSMQPVSQPMSLAKVHEQSGNRPPVITDLLNAARKQPDPHIRETLSTWTHLVSLRFAVDRLPEAAWQELKGPLEAIWKWHDPVMRYALANFLAQQCLPPEAKDVNGFFAFCRQFTKPRTRLYPALLFPLFQAAPDDPALPKLVTLLHRSEFKDAKRQKAVVNSLVALLQADRLPDNLKRSLLQAALPNGSDKEAARSLADIAPVMECMVSLAQNTQELGENVLQRLKSIRKPEDFNGQMHEMFKDLLPGLSNAQDATTRFSHYLEQARYPVGVLSYLARMKNKLESHKRAPVLTALSRFVNAVVLSPDPEQAFKQLRYDTSVSKHLRILENKAPTAFAQWQQPCIYEPSDAFLSDVSGSTKQTDIAAYLRQRIVRDRHVSPGAYPLLELVLTGKMPLPSALREVEQQVEASLLRLLDKQIPEEQKAELIMQLLASIPQGQFHRDLTDLKKLSMPAPRQGAKHFTVIDTDAAEDLFLCGTEVAGSCQSIQGSPHLNKALMGYVLDGKYRMLAIKSKDGRLMGRRMLRLLWDEQAQQPVLHLERLYRNPGVPEQYERALIELALQKARQMGCVLVSNDEKGGGDYPRPLIAHPTPWPFEYVDAEGLRVRSGREGYRLSLAKIVASPH